MDTKTMIAEFVAELDSDSRDLNKMQTIVNELSDDELHSMCKKIMGIETYSNNIDNE